MAFRKIKLPLNGMTIISLMATESQSEPLNTSGNSEGLGTKLPQIWHTHTTPGALCTKGAHHLVHKQI